MNWAALLIAAAVVVAWLLIKRLTFISKPQAQQLLREGALVVDVRTAGEFRAGHVPGALNLELGSLKEAIQRQVPDKRRVLLLHCLSGGRSGIARQQLRSLGYLSVHNLGSFSRAKSIVHGA
jgi:phage shock protein E